MNTPEIWWKCIGLGFIQGVTEFLPISSSGHLIAAKEILHFQEAQRVFDVALHVATLLAVLIYYRRELAQLLFHPARWRMLGLVILATIPGVALGMLLDKWRESPHPAWVVGGWTVSATYLLLTRGKGGDRMPETLPFWKGLLIGGAQACAIFPGVSRSGSTIASGLWLGLERDAACRFSFLLAIPLIAGAGLKDGLHFNASQLEAIGGWGPLAAGMGTAFFVGLLAIHGLLKLVRRNYFHHFGWYNLAAAAAFGGYLALRS